MFAQWHNLGSAMTNRCGAVQGKHLSHKCASPLHAFKNEPTRCGPAARENYETALTVELVRDHETSSQDGEQNGTKGQCANCVPLALLAAPPPSGGTHEVP
jgi:hypothetical protein